MAADPEFYPMDRTTCRQKLGLSLGKKIVGYCGSLYRNRGIEVMFQALEILRSQCRDLEIVFSGRREKGLSVPGGIRHLGYLPDHLIPIFLNTLDVVVIINRNSDFGNFSYPVKLYEAINCHIPVVATETGPIRWIIGNRQQFLAKPEDPSNLAAKIGMLLTLDRADYGDESTWDKSCEIFEGALTGKSIGTISRKGLGALPKGINI
jgi:glycosyltransferase involved in cell wall biosynthesis